MLYHVSNLAIITFEVICCKIFFETFFIDRNYSKKNFLIILQICFDYIFVLVLSQCFIIKEIAVILTIEIIMCAYLKANMKKIIIFSIIYQALLLLIDYIVYTAHYTLFSSDDEVKQKYIAEAMLVVALGKIILFLCVLLIRRCFERKSTKLLSNKEWLKFLLFPIFTMITITVMIINFRFVNDGKQENILWMIAIGLIGINLYMFYFINDIINKKRQIHQAEIIEIQMKNQIKMNQSAFKTYEEQKYRAHEFKNHILCIEALIKSKQYVELEAYVKKIGSVFTKETNILNTNHVMVNAILNALYQKATLKDILFVIRINDLSKLEMEDEDIVVLLSNLLNNAIEACEKCKEKRIIKFKFMIEENEVILSVKNTYCEPVVYKDNEIKTTKISKNETHGIGIKNIIRIVEKYEGVYVIQNNKEEFYFSIMIPCKI